jgi:hypothetical protein
VTESPQKKPSTAKKIEKEPKKSSDVNKKRKRTIEDTEFNPQMKLTSYFTPQVNVELQQFS